MAQNINIITDFKEARRKFNVQKSGATSRRIAWEMSFEEWVHIWNQSGHWLERGNKLGQYCMSRKGDIGPYSLDNVFIQLTAKNTSQANTGRTTIPWNKGIRMSDESRKKMSESQKKRAPHSLETIKKISASNLGKPKRKKHETNY